MTGITPAARPAGPGPAERPPSGQEPAPSAPAPEAAARIIQVIREYPCWSAFWDKRFGVWRVADDDPDSGLYAASSDVGTVIGYIQTHA